jgi:hypothetical protein
VLKKLTATGILAAATAGVMLSGGPAEADLLSAHPATASAAYPVDPCLTLVPGVYRPSWCTTYTPPVTYYPPTTYYPGYNSGYNPGYNPGWNRWHHGGWNHGHFHR